jgi:hypothetical protein
MLSSITPLGERSRGNRWGLTVSAFVLGSVAGGTVVGSVLGAAGALLRWAGVGTTATAIVAALLAAIALVFDASGGRVGLPRMKRQVNEDWMSSYRGWVYGLGWGVQLGMGLATIVTAAIVYLAFALMVLSGHAIVGALIGAVFGAVRGLTVLAVARVRTPEALLSFQRRLQRAAPGAQAGAIIGDAVVVIAAIAVIV